MTSWTLSETLTLETIECGKCGIVFAVPRNWKTSRVATHGEFHCPNGCVRVFVAETEAEKFKRLYEQEQRSAASLREAKVVAERAKTKAENSLRRLKKRTAAGVCPCCNRTVSQLQRHMQSKHQEFLQLHGLAAAKQLPEKVQ